MPKIIKIGVGVPTIGQVKSQTAISLMNMMKLPYDFNPIFAYGPYISENRETIVKIALKGDCTHILFIDHDMKFPPYTIEHLIKQDKDIIAVPYNYKYLPKQTMIKFFDENGGMSKKVLEMPSEIFKVWGMGTGCMLIKADVFRKIKPPYFQMTYFKDGKVDITEDISFCIKARENGYDLWCDPTLLLEHVGDYLF